MRDGGARRISHAAAATTGRTRSIVRGGHESLSHVLGHSLHGGGNDGESGRDVPRPIHRTTTTVSTTTTHVAAGSITTPILVKGIDRPSAIIISKCLIGTTAPKADATMATRQDDGAKLSLEPSEVVDGIKQLGLVGEGRSRTSAYFGGGGGPFDFEYFFGMGVRRRVRRGGDDGLDDFFDFVEEADGIVVVILIITIIVISDRREGTASSVGAGAYDAATRSSCCRFSSEKGGGMGRRTH